MGFFLFVFASPVVALFYQSKNFTTGDIAEAAMFLKLLAVTIFSIGINAMVTRVFIAVQAIKEAFFYQVFLNILLIAAIWVFTKYHGAYGYPYGVIIINMVNYFAMYFVCRKLVPQINYGALLKYTGIIILINAIIATGLYLGFNYFKSGVLITIISGFLGYLFILLILNRKFKLNTELGAIFKHAKQKFY